MWQSSRNVINLRVRGVVRTLVWRFRENTLHAHDITYAGHYEKSLLRDNDSRCYLRKIKIISSDWIVLLRRLLNASICSLYPYWPLPQRNKAQIVLSWILAFVTWIIVSNNSIEQYNTQNHIQLINNWIFKISLFCLYLWIHVIKQGY